jgi:peptide/nickel transport system substrate-binding protein
MTKNPIAATAVSLLALGLALGVTPAMAAKMDVTIGMQLEPPNLDPTGGAAAAIDEVVYANVFEGLTRFGADGSILPALAKSWEISEDGLTYTFMLNEGVKFHDGTDFNAEDVKFSLDRARADDSTNAQKALFADIASVEVVDPATVKVTLSKPNGSFLFNMAWGDAVIVAPGIGRCDQRRKSGRHRPLHFDRTGYKGDRVERGRYDGYWGTPAGWSARDVQVHLRPHGGLCRDDGEDIDAFWNFPAPENLPQFEADPRFQVLVGSTEGETILSMNNKLPPLERSAGAPRHFARHRPAGDHRRGDVRAGHADRHAFCAAPSRLRGSDRQFAADPGPGGNCWPRRGCPTGSPPR